MSDEFNLDIVKKREKIQMYELYEKSLEPYINWIDQQINLNKNGCIRVRRGELAIAMKKELAELMGKKYKERTFNSLFKIIRVVLFNEGIFVEPGLYADRERVFKLRRRKNDDILIPSLADLEKSLRNSKIIL